MSLSQSPLNWAAKLAEAATSYWDASPGKPYAPSVRTAIQNVHVWDGNQRIPNTTVVIEGKTISLTGNTIGAKMVDGKGGFLMPGLIDAHVHASSKNALDVLAHYGITTAFDMGSFPSSQMPQWHDVSDQGITSLLFSGGAACVGGGFPAFLPGFPEDALIYSKDNATNYVDSRVSEGVDYLKVFINSDQLPRQEFQQIIKDKGEAAGKSLISHAPDYNAQTIARAVGGKFITHVPKEKALSEEGVQEMLDKKQIAIPTLVMMQRLISIGQWLGKPYDYHFANASVALMYELGVPILVGSDAAKLLHGFVLYGSSMHTEMRLLAGAGMSNEDILRGATSRAAHHFGLSDRGVIEPGMRADLLLLSADPLDDISNSDKITQIWTAGTPVQGLLGAWWNAEAFLPVTLSLFLVVVSILYVVVYRL